MCLSLAWSPLFSFSNHNFECIFYLPHVTCPTHLILLGVVKIIFGEGANCEALHYAVCSRLLQISLPCVQVSPTMSIHLWCQLRSVEVMHNLYELGPSYYTKHLFFLNPLNAELNPTCHLVALLGVHHFPHVSRMRVKSLTLRLLMSYIYMEHLFLMFLDHTRRRISR